MNLIFYRQTNTTTTAKVGGGALVYASAALFIHRLVYSLMPTPPRYEKFLFTSTITSYMTVATENVTSISNLFVKCHILYYTRKLSSKIWWIEKNHSRHITREYSKKYANNLLKQWLSAIYIYVLMLTTSPTSLISHVSIPY